MRILLAFITGAVFALSGSPKPSDAADAYPNRPITMIVPFAPGGPSDVVGRLIAHKMTEELGQSVIVENRPGANTIIGASLVARSKPDGYTLLLALDGTLVMNQFLYSTMSYDPIKDFAPVTLVAEVPGVIEANKDLPVATVKDLIQLARTQPGKLNVGVSTPASQVRVSLFNTMAGVDLTAVPYPGGTSQITALLAGNIQLAIEAINIALPMQRDGKVKILGLVGSERMSSAPEIPTVAETLPGFDLSTWLGVVVPAATPKDIVKVLYDSLVKTMADKELRAKLTAVSLEPKLSRSPEEFAAFIQSQAEMREKVIKATNMKLN